MPCFGEQKNFTKQIWAKQKHITFNQDVDGELSRPWCVAAAILVTGTWLKKLYCDFGYRSLAEEVTHVLGESKTLEFYTKL